MYNFRSFVQDAINLRCFHYFISSYEARYLAHNYSTQWPGDETHPVHVTGDMTRYLTTKAKDVGLGDFNRKDLIAATFTKKSDKGYLFTYLFFAFTVIAFSGDVERILRTVPAFATAHTICPPRDGPRGSDFLRTVLPNPKVFLRGF